MITLEFMGELDVNGSIHISFSGIIGSIISALANLIITLFRGSIIDLGVGKGKKEF